MQHVKPTSKGDPLCPLGFHPQVRWPTRCKRCFRDYKEHGNRNKEQDSHIKSELTASTPALSTFSTSRSNNYAQSFDNSLGSRNWTSSSNLSTLSDSRKTNDDFNKSSSISSSWTSSPNLAEKEEEPTNVTVSFTLPRRRPSKTVDEDKSEEDARRTQFTVRRRTPVVSSVNNEAKTPSPSRTPAPASSIKSKSVQKEDSKSGVDFMFQVKSAAKPPVKKDTTSYKSIRKPESSDSEDDSIATETTDTTLVNDRELQDEIESLKKELDEMKHRCEKAEREKSDFMLRRLASSDTVTSRTSASEVLKLQQKVNELKNLNEDLKDDKKSLTQKVRELETDLGLIRSSGVQREVQVLREKLQRAETVCEELMEANEDMKKEIRDMEEEMDEMQDKFREDRADEYTSLKKELEKQTKNCRILSFKLRKAERRAEQLDAEKLEVERKCREVAGGQSGLDKVERIKQLEHDLSVANEAAARLQKELEETNSKLKSNDKDVGGVAVKKKAPKLGSLPKTPSGDKVSRESLTRGDSQEDPVQLLRDLQDSMEREADLREQLRFAEEEAESLRKKSSRVEDDNESLVLQLKKMATKARTRRHSPSQNRLTPEPVDKDEGISDEDDPSELRVLLELNEQESAVLRRKVEDLEVEGEHMKRKVRELQEKLNSKSAPNRKSQSTGGEPSSTNAVYERKMKVLEDEMGELRMKLIEKERECERLHAEISVGGKKPKTIQKSRSFEGEQQNIDLKRQLQVIETETNVLRTKIHDLESENEKLQADNRKLIMTSSRRSSSTERLSETKSVITLEKQLEESLKKIKELEAAKPAGKDGPIPVGEIEKLKTQLKKAETERQKNEETLKRLKDEAMDSVIEYYKKRTPKKPTDTSTKLQMKKMVEELENEISEILVIMKKTGGLKGEKELASAKSELEKTKAKLDALVKDAKEENLKKEQEISLLNKMVKDLESDKLKLKRESDKSKTAFEKEKEKLAEEKKQLEKSKSELGTEIEKLKLELKNGNKDLEKRLETLTNELNEEKKLNEQLKSEMQASSKNTAESSKLENEVETKTKKIEELEAKIKEIEEKVKKSEKLASSRKEKLAKLEKENEDLGNKILELEKEKNSILSDKKVLQAKLAESTAEKDTKSKTGKTSKLSEGKEELEAAQSKIKELTDKIESMENALKTSQSEMEKKEKTMKKEIEDWEKKASELEMDLQAATGESTADRKLMSRLKAAQEEEMKAKDLEIAQLRTTNLTAGNVKIQELESQIERLEVALESEKHEYEELTNKYEQLEEEHVIMKATLVKEKEKIQSKLRKSDAEIEDLEQEIKKLKDTYNTKMESWKKDKAKFEEKINEYDKVILEKNRVQALCDEKQSEVDQYKKESEVFSDQLNYMRKENEELRKQMEDYEKVSKVQRNMTADVSEIQNELKEYKTKLVMEEKAKKTELSKLKHRYEQRMAVLSEEMLSIQGQMARFKRERDSYRHMLEDAHKSISDMKNGGSGSRTVEGGDDRMQLESLEQQISCLEDELSESRIEASRLRTELVSERSAWEVKLSELNSKLNELEEEKVLSSGRTKITGLKTRMELAWHKEREEQHRLLQETSTLARDLRQTLFEVERERDRERLEGKRRLDQLKKVHEEEQDEIRKKLNELQCDLLELRDAHAKLRTTNEKLRREKDKLDRERELLRQSITMKKRMEQEEERQIISVAQLVEELTVLAPELFPSKPKPSVALPTPPARRKGGKSREASPALERKDYSRESSTGREDAKTHEVNEILRRLTEAANELKKSQRDERSSSVRRSYSSFRSSSIESDGGVEPVSAVKRRSGLVRKGSTLRKSLSLEQTSQEQQAIYMDDTEGSQTSIQSLEDVDRYPMFRRDQSMDSRLSGGSTQSEIIPSSEKRKKKGFFGKLKNLTKSRSIDHDKSDVGSSGQMDQGSDISLSEDKSKLKDKFTGMFKKSGSTSRGNSMERSMKPPTPKSSIERPLVGSLSGDVPLTRKPPSTAPLQRKVKKL